MKLASLGSGSKGNATLVATESTRLLVDCGFSVKELEVRARRLAFDLASLDAILVTHEHSDHASGVASLARRYDLPVYLSFGTARSQRLAGCPGLQCFNADSEFAIGDIGVNAVAVPHDAREPVQYLFSHRSFSVGVLTDLGSVSPHVASSFRSTDLLLLEFNHDRELLRTGPYPAQLKRRVGGDWGHLSNDQALALLMDSDHARLQALVVAHVSEQNNRRDRVEGMLGRHLPSLLPRVVWADQDRGFSWLSVAEAPAVAAY